MVQGLNNLLTCLRQNYWRESTNFCKIYLWSVKRLHKELVPTNAFKNVDLKDELKDFDSYHSGLHAQFMADGIFC